MTVKQPSFIIVTNTSVLINFLNINRLDLLSSSSLLFLVTEHVREEIILDYSEQVQRYEQVLKEGIINEIVVDSLTELTLFSHIKQNPRLGQGECSAMTIAINRGYSLAIDDRRAIKEAFVLAPKLTIVKTEDIMVIMIKEKLLTVAEADIILADWAANYRFQLKIKSFSELL